MFYLNTKGSKSRIILSTVSGQVAAVLKTSVEQSTWLPPGHRWARFSWLLTCTLTAACVVNRFESVQFFKSLWLPLTIPGRHCCQATPGWDWAPWRGHVHYSPTGSPLTEHWGPHSLLLSLGSYLHPECCEFSTSTSTGWSMKACHLGENFLLCPTVLS